MAVLQISPAKVARIIELAGEFDAKTAPWDEGDGDREEDIEAVLELTSRDPIALELKALIDSLSDDEQVSLVAIAWIGRGTYDAEELDEALATARAERVNKTSHYLLGQPQLADYLSDGMEQLESALCDEG